MAFETSAELLKFHNVAWNDPYFIHTKLVVDTSCFSMSELYFIPKLFGER